MQKDNPAENRTMVQTKKAVKEVIVDSTDEQHPSKISRKLRNRKKRKGNLDTTTMMKLFYFSGFFMTFTVYPLVKSTNFCTFNTCILQDTSNFFY